MTTDTSNAERRLARAQARVDEATRVARAARIAAAPVLRQRARRRTRTFWWSMVALSLVALTLVVATVILGLQVRAADTRGEQRAAVITAADAAVITMLSADPAAPQAYVDAVVAVSTGARRERIESIREALAAEVAAQPGPSVGQVISTGLVTDPPDDAADGSRVELLTVADATNPALLGGTAPAPGQDRTAQRITVALTMVKTGDGWLIADARAL
ncbi:putative membrane glycoprotein [Gordonia bronchialis DSM 43247]|uniref:Membrane glycoprotein n=1 Tax=Gordonia bronchialis (strain ATCC 25592 / DSM 43247 / BCRC 13721 / JCM 3198 / KCTC 3076 / NBRC 16047 / NCTC 10667) TaxID=526226 RepID=D0L336_GORB4|nr:hypothetical protein [Gordonia bronchialis]ACY22966.1 putative membrane glycoprotein [Gordonia bronchialis DSM 43247]MCC3325746.1 hypothetical protein [Gordonia bronchialis]QGS23602.1 hypothetical protein FOB84_04860 [Gordonia bronchialis]UAK40228.1 hypothetical protein K8O93_11785 [Gordonia bronchialis]STQ65917.1 Uncharacterised protein [Gordonia bronchialis]